MSIRSRLAIAHSRKVADEVLGLVLQNQNLVRELLDCFYQTENIKITQRAAMVVGDLGREKPYWLDDEHGKLIAYATRPPHPAVRRAITRYFSEYPADIHEDLEGLLLDLSLKLIVDENEPVTGRVFSMTTALKLCRKYPDIAPELKAAIESGMEHGSNGFKSRGRKVLKALG
ncbi:MAG: hypothetical protein AAFO91_03735 [Bacteroidota bacterium]